MRSFNFIVTLLFAFVATSYAFPEFHLLEARKGHKNGTEGASKKNGTNTINKTCKQMAKLTKLTNLANNQTKMDALVAKGKLNDTELADLKTKAADAATKLKAMEANSTLVSECAVVDAHQKVLGQCKKIKSLTKLANLKNNQTAMDAFMAKKKLNDTQMAKLEAKIANATTKLQEMQSNTTLTDLCAQQQQQKGSNGASGTSSGTQAAATASTGGAAMQAIPYIFMPALATVFALFL